MRRTDLRFVFVVIFVADTSFKCCPNLVKINNIMCQGARTLRFLSGGTEYILDLYNVLYSSMILYRIITYNTLHT